MAEPFAPTSRITGYLKRLIREVLTEDLVDFTAFYAGRVVSQNSTFDATDIEPEDTAKFQKGWGGVPFALSFVPHFQLAAHQRIFFGFQNGDPGRPRIVGVDGLAFLGGTLAIPFQTNFAGGDLDPSVKQVARTDDFVDDGVLDFNSSAGNVLALKWTGGDGNVHVASATITAALSGSTITVLVTPSGVGAPGTGKIKSTNAGLFIGDKPI